MGSQKAPAIVRLCGGPREQTVGCWCPQRPGPCASLFRLVVRALGTLTRHLVAIPSHRKRHFQSHIMVFRSEMFLQAALRAQVPGWGRQGLEEPQTLPSVSQRSMEEGAQEPSCSNWTLKSEEIKKGLPCWPRLRIHMPVRGHRFHPGLGDPYPMEQGSLGTAVRACAL